MITLKENEDGTLLGADEDGNLFIGTPVAITYDKLDVVTNIARDRLSYTRTTSYKDEIHSQGVTTKGGFESSHQELARSKALGELRAAWDTDNQDFIGTLDLEDPSDLAKQEKKWRDYLAAADDQAIAERTAEIVDSMWEDDLNLVNHDPVTGVTFNTIDWEPK